MSMRETSGSTSVASPPDASNRQPHQSLVSVLLTTLPAGRLRHRDVARLDALLRRMELTLARERDLDLDIATLSKRLRRLAETAARRPARRGLGLFVGGESDRAVTLPQPVFDRVVIDSFWDWRDVMVAQQFSPQFRVIVVRHGFAQLYDSRHDDTLIERRDRFPISAADLPTPADFAQRIADEVAAADIEDPRPCVLAADDADLRASFDSLVPSSVGVLAASASWARTDVVHRLARRQVSDRRGSVARATIPPANASGWAHGLQATKAMIQERPYGTLLVETNLNDLPARGIQVVDPDPVRLHLAGLNAAISRVSAAGGTVLFVEDRDLLAHGGVTYRPHPG